MKIGSIYGKALAALWAFGLAFCVGFGCSDDDGGGSGGSNWMQVECADGADKMRLLCEEDGITEAAIHNFKLNCYAYYLEDPVATADVLGCIENAASCDYALDVCLAD